MGRRLGKLYQAPDIDFGDTWKQVTYAPGGYERDLLEAGYGVYFRDDVQVMTCRLVAPGIREQGQKITWTEGYGKSCRDAIAMTYGHYLLHIRESA